MAAGTFKCGQLAIVAPMLKTWQSIAERMATQTQGLKMSIIEELVKGVATISPSTYNNSLIKTIKNMKGLFVLFIVALVIAAVIDEGIHKHGSLKKYVEHLKDVEE